MAVYTNEKARPFLLAGASELDRVCQILIGPAARTVLFATGQHVPFATQDGVTAVREIILPDHLENIGADLLRSAAQKTNDTSGDGTTTTVLLAYAMLKGVGEALASGVDAINLAHRLDDFKDLAIDIIRRNVIELKDEAQIEAIASTSADDARIGKLITEAITKIGKDGLFTVDEGFGHEPTLEIENGTIAEGGFFIPEYGGEQSEIIVENAYILLTTDTIQEPNSLINIMSTIKKNGGALVTLSGGLHSTVSATFRENRKRGLRVYAAKAPLIGEKRRDFLEDLAVLTGGVVFSNANGLPYKKAMLELLGRAKTIKLRSDKTIVYGGEGTEDNILARVRSLRQEIATAPSSYEREQAQVRLARLTGGVAVIKLAGNQLSQRLMKFRIEDAVKATQSAMEEGVVPGGGTTLLRVAKYMVVDNEAPSEVRWAHSIFKKALVAPFYAIVGQDSPVNPGLLEEQVYRASPTKVYNAKTRQIEECMTSGIIDPFKVIRMALENATSLAKMLATSGTVIARPVHEVNIVEKNYKGKRPNQYYQRT